MTIYEKLADLFQSAGKDSLFRYECFKIHGAMTFNIGIIDTRWNIYTTLCEIFDFLRANYQNSNIVSHTDTPMEHDKNMRHMTLKFTI